MKKKGSRKGLGDLKRGAKRNEGEIEHLKRRTRPLKRKCKFRTTPCVMRKFRILVRTQTESMVLKICPKNEFAQGSHSCEIRTRDFGNGPRACFFGNCHKSIFAQGVCYAKISHNKKCCAKMAESWFFLPCFPLFSP